MDEYIEETNKYNIDGKEYTVISKCKKNSDNKKIYEIIAEYVLNELYEN